MAKGERIKKLRELRGLTQVELAEKIDVTKQNLYKYENDVITNIPSDKIELIAEALNTTPAYIMGWSESPQQEPSNMVNLTGMDFVKIPIIGRVAAGLGCLADNEIVGYEYTDAEDIKGTEDYRFLRVVGDSMYPKIEDGDLLLVRSQTSVDSGSIAVVIIDDEDGVVKRVVYGKDFIELHSINPMYPVRRFENEDVLRVRVCGLVKQIKRKL